MSFSKRLDCTFSIFLFILAGDFGKYAFITMVKHRYNLLNKLNNNNRTIIRELTCMYVKTRVHIPTRICIRYISKGFFNSIRGLIPNINL